MADTTLTSPSDVAEAAKKSGERALSEAKARVQNAAEAQCKRAADAVHGMAGVLHRAASDLKTENETMGRYTDMAADRLDHFAGYLRGTSLSDVLSNAEDFARREPAWFIGGALATGFLVARAVKNAAESGRSGAAGRFGRHAPSTPSYGLASEPGIYPAGQGTTAPVSSSTIPGGPLSGEGV